MGVDRDYWCVLLLTHTTSHLRFTHTSGTRALEMRFPEPFASFHSFIAAIAGLSIAQLLPLSCYVEYSHHSHLLVMTLVPLALVAVSLAARVCASQRYRKSVAQHAKNEEEGKQEEPPIDRSGVFLAAAFMVLFLSLPASSTTILRTFHCLTFEDGTGSYLYAHLSIDCESDVQRRMEIYAWLMVMVFPVGVPSIYFVSLYRVRDKINPKRATSECMAFALRSTDVSLTPLKPLFLMYRPEFWYFEVVDVVRRIVM